MREQVPKRKGEKGEVIEWTFKRDIEFEVFRRMEFNSDRKRMSIIVRDPDDGHYKLYCKGADSIIKERLEAEQINAELMETVDDFLTKASTKGFRTLLMAMRVLEKKEVDGFL